MRARYAVIPLAATAALAVTGAAPATTHDKSIPRCGIEKLRLDYLGEQGAAGTMFSNFRYRKRGKGTCTLRGFPRAALLGKNGNKLKKIKVKHDKSVKVRTRKLFKGHPLYFHIRHPSFDPKTTKPCTRQVWRFKIKAPGHTRALTVGGGQPALYCNAGAKITPVKKTAP